MWSADSPDPDDDTLLPDEAAPTVQADKADEAEEEVEDGVTDVGDSDIDVDELQGRTGEAGLPKVLLLLLLLVVVLSELQPPRGRLTSV